METATTIVTSNSELISVLVTIALGAVVRFFEKRKITKKYAKSE